MSIFPRVSSKVSKPIKSSPPQFKDEIAGILFVVAGLLIFLSIWSYSPTDRLIFDSMEDANRQASSPQSNLIGSVGATIAFGLFWLYGGAAYAVPLLIVFQGVRSFAQEGWRSNLRCLVGSILAVFFLSSLIYLLSPVPDVKGESSTVAGGVAGQTLALALVKYFAHAGSLILLATGLLVSLIFIKPFSLVSTAQQASGIWSVFVGLKKIFSFIPFPNGESVGRLKANKPVKINRSLTTRGGTSSYSLKQESKEEEFRDESVETKKAFSSKSSSQEKNEEVFSLDFHRKVSQGYRPPNPVDLLELPPLPNNRQTDKILETQSQVLTGALQSFGIGGKVTEIHPGPVITMYEFEPNPGIKVARIVTLAHDLAMALKATSVRIVAPLPGKSTVGVEVPNPIRETVALREILTSDVFVRSRSKLALALGKDIFGRPMVTDLKTMPHLLVAGATGAGKSVGLNSMLLSILFSTHPDEVKLLLIDPKVLELQVYDGIPHLLRPVITNPKAASRGLTWVVQEMERRYRLLAEHGVRHIQAFNVKVAKLAEQRGNGSVPEAPVQLPLSLEGTDDGDALNSGESTMPVQETGPLEPLPYIVVVVDEFADLMMVGPKEVEEKIARLAQMARASGIHLILATQRPSVDVVTGLIKANFPARIAYQVSSKIDSRTILDANGAEALLGLGDMLYMASGTGRIVRMHGSYVSDEDVRRVVEWVKAQAGPAYSEDSGISNLTPPEPDEEKDEVYEQAKEIVLSTGQASASLIQRRLRVGYPRAARMIEQMEEDGLVSAQGRDGRREVVGRRMVIGEEVG